MSGNPTSPRTASVPDHRSVRDRHQPKEKGWLESDARRKPSESRVAIPTTHCQINKRAKNINKMQAPDPNRHHSSSLWGIKC